MTASLKALPVPPLDQTLQRYLQALRPISTDAEWQASAAAVASYAVRPGPAHQGELERFAAERAAAGTSWLAQAWLAGYLDTRGPLPLTTNVGWLVNWPPHPTGIALAADVVHRMAAIHLAHLRGELPGEVTARGEPVDAAQRAFLAGGIREPHPGRDALRPGPGHPENREIVVLRNGAAYALEASDAVGHPLSPAHLRAGLEQMAHDGAAHLPDLSYLGSEVLADVLAQLLAVDGNAVTYERLAGALFVVNLTQESGDDDAFLQRLTFAPGQAWAYKTVTYQVDLAGGRVGIHMEHSTVDGATIKNLIALAQQVEVADSPGDTDLAARVEALGWRVPADVERAVASAVADYRNRSATHRVRTVAVDVELPDVGVRLSADAVAQWLMMYAQLATFGRVRSTYEAVDMREYLAGRTECLRPVGAAGLALVHAMYDDAASVSHVVAAGAEHKEWVKWCKTGQAIDRHLFGLAEAARRLRVDSAVLEAVGPDAAGPDAAGLERLTTDFLSTSSLGDRHQLVRFAFAPTSTGGLGISYSAGEGRWEFCVTYREDERGEDVDGFVAALAEGARRLAEALGRDADGATVTHRDRAVSPS